MASYIVVTALGLYKTVNVEETHREKDTTVTKRFPSIRSEESERDYAIFSIKHDYKEGKEKINIERLYPFKSDKLAQVHCRSFYNGNRSDDDPRKTIQDYRRFQILLVHTEDLSPELSDTLKSVKSKTDPKYQELLAIARFSSKKMPMIFLTNEILQYKINLQQIKSSLYEIQGLKKAGATNSNLKIQEINKRCPLLDYDLMSLKLHPHNDQENILSINLRVQIASKNADTIYKWYKLLKPANIQALLRETAGEDLTTEILDYRYSKNPKSSGTEHRFK